VFQCEKILIIGAESYIGTSLEKWLSRYPLEYNIETIDVRLDDWRNEDFSSFDVAFHVAGIADVKETRSNRQLFYRVNRDLAYEVALKAKSEGVKQFMFVSSISVYGLQKGVIDKNTPLEPRTSYGKSKLEAEKLVKSLEDHRFTVTILRPPMVYGKGCKGNYPRLAKLALIAPVFPDIDNKRSMIHIDNLCEFVKVLIDNRLGGTFFPQNPEYVKTSEMVRLIARSHGKEIRLTRIFNPIIKMLRIPVVTKVFGDLVYSKDLSSSGLEVRMISLEESIHRTSSLQ